MDRKNFKGTPQTLIKDARSGDIKKIIHPADTEIGIPELPKDLIVHGTISGSIHHTSDGLSYLVGGTNVEIRSGSNGQLTISAQGASGASSSLSYVTIASEATLSAERVLTGGTGLKISDGGANSNVTLNVHDGTFASLTGSNFTGNTTFSSGLSGSLQRTSAGISYLVGGTNVTIASSSNGQVTISAAAASGAPSTAQYLTLATDLILSNERVFVPSTGLKIVDGGAGGNYSISIHDGTFAALTGSNFTGNVKFQSSVSGSIQKLSSGESYLVGGSNISVSSASNGQITISTTNAAPQNTQYLTLASDSTLTDERVLSASNGIIGEDLGPNNNYSLSIDNRVVATISGSTFVGPIEASAAHGITGSITQIRLIGGTLFPFISAPYGNSITVTTGSFGEIVLSGSGGGGGSGSTLGGGDPGAQYLVLANTASLSNERAFVASTGLKTVDAGANSSYTLSVHDGTFAALTGSVFSGTVSAPSLSGSLTRLSSGLSALVGIGGTQIISQSNGQIWISSSAGGSGGGGASVGASYLQLSADGTNAAERVFTPSTGLVGVDNGSNSTYILSVNDGVVATLSGSTFTGPIVLASNGGITGSLTRLVGGTPFITSPAGNIITITTGSLGQIIISGSGDGTGTSVGGSGGGDPGAQYLVLAATASLSNERVLTPSTGLFINDAGANGNYTIGVNDRIFAGVSGSTFTGPVIGASNGGFTGSLTTLTSGAPFITAVAGNVITVSTGSGGQIIFSGSGGSNTGAPLGSAYVTIGSDAQLTSERSLTAGTGLTLTDGGANSTATFAINNGVVATISGSTFTGPVIGASNGGFTGSLTRLAGGTPFVTVPAGNVITVSTGALGQIIISGSGGTPQDLSLYAPLAGATFTGAITAVNAGGITGSITRLVGGTPFITAPAGNVITVTTGSNGQIILSGSGGSSPSAIPGGDPGAQYLVLATTASLSAERTLVPSTGLFSTDAGANGNFTLGVNDRFFAALTGSVFTGVLSASGGISGSIQQVAPGLSYLVGGTNVVVTSASNGQITISGTSFAPLASNYLTVGTDATLTNERSLVAGTGLRTTDAGAGSTFTFFVNDSVVATLSGSIFTGTVTAPALSGSHTRLTDGTSFITGLGGITVTSASNGQITISGSLGNQNTYAPPNAQYITLATDSTLTSERVFVPSVGLKAVDAGANGNYTLSVHDGTFAALSGSNFSGPVLATGGLSGSLQKLVDGTSYLVGIGGVTVTSQSNGQIFISASAGGSGGGGASIGASYLQLSSDATNNSERVFTPSVGLFSVDGGANSTYTLGVNDRIFAALTGSVFTGVLSASAGISGSIQQVGPNLSYLVAQGGITITTGSNGQITISGSVGNTNTYAPPAASYITIGSDATLTNERSLAAGTGIILVDGGANSTATLSIRDSIVATISGSTFTGPVVGASNGGFTGSLTRLAGGTPFITVPAGNMISITTGSLGQIILSGTGDGASSGAPANAQYLTLATDATLSAERVLVPSTGLFSADAGANGNFTIGVNDRFFAALTGSTFGGPVVASSTSGITGSITQLVSGAPFVTVVPNNIITISTGSGGQIILSGNAGSNIGAPASAQFLTLATDSLLTVERVFTPGIGLKSVDAGAGSTYTVNANDGVLATISGSTFTGPVVGASNGGFTGSLTRLAGGLPFITVPAGNIISITTGSLGQIILSGSGDGTGGSSSGGGGDPGAQYLTLALTASLPNERVFTPSTGIRATDAGAGSTYTLSINDGVVATISGSAFTGNISAPNFAGAHTGSHTLLSNGTSAFIGVGGITITTGSLGQVLISGTAGNSNNYAPPAAQYLTLATDATLTAERVFVPSTGLKATDAGANGNYTLSVHDGTFATISGSTFTGPVVGASNGGFTGSLTRLAGGTPFITVPAGNIISITTGSLGQIILSGTGDGTGTSVGGSGGGDPGAQYLVLVATASLPNERVFTPGSGISITDAGAGGAYTVSVNDRFFAALTGSVFTGVLSASAGISGSIQRVGPNLSYLVGAGATTVTSQSNGQIIISSSAGTGAPGGNSGTIQINASGSFSGSNQFYYDLFNNRAATGPAGLEIGNPAGTFGTVIQSSATTADRIATIPLTTTSDTFVMLALNQTLTTKTLTSPTINTPVFGSNAIVSTGEGRFGRIFTSGAVQIGARTTGESALVPTEQVMWVSGSFNLPTGATRRVAVFGGDVISSGSFQAPWFSGSIQKTNAGLSYLVGVGGTSIISQSNGQIWISSSVGGGAGSVPTGTGFRHITANSEDGTAKLVVNADVDAAAAIAGTKIDPDFGSQTVQTANNMICGNILATSYYETAGSGQATTGNIRLANTNKMVFRNNADTLDACGMEYSVGDVMFIGMTSGYTDQAYGIITGASQYMYLSIASAFYIHLEASEVRMTHPVVGDDTEFACHGAVTSAMVDANYTVPAGEYKYYTIKFTCLGGTTRTVTFPHPSSDARSYTKQIIGSTEKNLTISTGTGTTVTVALTTSQIVEFTSAGVRKIGPAY